MSEVCILDLNPSQSSPRGTNVINSLPSSSSTPTPFKYLVTAAAELSALSWAKLSLSVISPSGEA